jgi:flagellar hook protein FlgE
MLRSLFSGVSGLRTHQVRMDVIGNNIANINTIGFKTGRVNFYEMLNQTIQGPQAPSDDQGGTNPLQVGLGTTVGSIDTIFTQGNLQFTGRITDLAVQGDGFLLVQDGERSYVTRDGGLALDSTGALTHAGTGFRVMGWNADSAGVIDISSPIVPLAIPIGSQIPPRASTTIAFGGNLNSSDAVGPSSGWTTTMTVYDSLGNAQQVVLDVEKSGVNAWSWNASVGGAAVGGGTLTFDATGTLLGSTGAISIPLGGGATTPLDVAPDFARVTQLAAPSSVGLFSQDGYATGTLQAYTIDGAGVITGQYSNGRTQSLGQIAVAQVTNPSGLLKAGGNLYAESANSGTLLAGVAGSGSRGTLVSGALEMSNVDLGQEFTNMIIAQRGFQANSRVITTSDEMLQDLISVIR